jgi:hypothetical protein
VKEIYHPSHIAGNRIQNEIYEYKTTNFETKDTQLIFEPLFMSGKLTVSFVEHCRDRRKN